MADGVNDVPDNQNFTYGYDVAWKVLGDCSNTAINQSWTIPESLDVVQETVFNIVVENMTEPDAGSRTTGPAFTIKAGSPTGDGGLIVAATPTATTTGPPAESSPSTRTTATLSPAPVGGDGDVSRKGAEQNLSVSAKAGIGAGAGVSALFFLLALLLLLLWKRRRRSIATSSKEGAGDPSTDVEKAGAELHGDSKKTVLEVEAMVPRELATGNDDDDDDEKKMGLASPTNSDAYTPSFHTEPIEMPANEAVVVEMPDNSRTHG